LLYVLLGEDDYSVRQSLEKIKNSIGDETVRAANITVFDGRQLTVDQLRNSCETVPFLAEKRLVIVEGLLERFNDGGNAGRKKRKSRTGQSDTYFQEIAGYLHRIPDFTTLVLVEGKIGNSNPLLKEASSAKAEIQVFPLLKRDRLRQWIKRRVKEAGGSISEEAVGLLEKYVGSNLWVMASEIDKLTLFARDRAIEAGDVGEVVSSAQEVSVFALVDALLEFRAGEAEKLLEQLLQRGAAPSYILVMLVRQARMLIVVKELRKQRKSGVEIRGKLGLTSEFVFNRISEQANRYSLERLGEMYHRLLEADISIKTGKCEGELALNILVAELSQLSSVSTTPVRTV